MIKRYVSISLLLVLLSQLAACGKSEIPGETSAVDSQAPVTGLTVADLIGFDKEDNGAKTFRMLCSDNKGYEYNADELTGDVVSDAVFAKNRIVEDYLGIDFEFNFQSNIWNDRTIFNNLIISDVMSGAGDIDLVQGIVACTMPLTLEGYFIEGKTLSYCDFEKPWWLSDMYGRFSVDGKLYGLIGDASLSLYKDMSVIFFNKRIWDEYKAPNPYELVRNNEWTLDKFIELASGMSKDLNGDGKFDITADQLTFTCEIVPAGTFQTALELTLVKLSKDGVPGYSGLTEKFQTAYDKLQALHRRDDVTHLNTQDSTFDSAKTFATGNIATMANFIWATEYMRDMKDDYGILPLPKYDKAQDKYVTQVGTSTTTLLVPKTTGNVDLTSKVIECLSFFSNRDVIHKYYEVALKDKYARDEDVIEMLDIIRSGATFDFLFYYGTSLTSAPFTYLRECTSTSLASDFESNKTAFTKSLENLIEKYKVIEK